MKKITLEELLNRKLDNGLQTKDVEIKNLGGSIPVVKQPLATVLRIMGGINKDTDLATQFDLMKELIYTACPLLHNKELQEHYECVEPTDIVCKVLHDNLEDISTLAEEIMDFYGAVNIMDEIKK